MATAVQIDHITPIAINSESWDDYINRLLCPVEELQVLCKACHKIKTKEESEQSKETQ